MSILDKIKRALGGSAAKTVIAVGGTALTQAVAAAAQANNPIGIAAAKAVTAAEATGQSGPAKKTAVVAAILPLIVAAVSKPGANAFGAEVEEFAELVVEEVVAMMKQTPILQLAIALLKPLVAK